MAKRTGALNKKTPTRAVSRGLFLPLDTAPAGVDPSLIFYLVSSGFVWSGEIIPDHLTDVNYFFYVVMVECDA